MRGIHLIEAMFPDPLVELADLILEHKAEHLPKNSVTLFSESFAALGAVGCRPAIYHNPVTGETSEDPSIQLKICPNG